MLDLNESIVLSKKCLKILLDNRYKEALELSAKYMEDSLYHSHINSWSLWLSAYLGLEKSKIDEAQAASKRVVQLCESVRCQTWSNNFFFNLFWKTNYEEWTDEEIHAELIRIEQIMLSLLMEFFVDASLLVLIKVSYRIRMCYQTYKSFNKIFENRQWSSNTAFKEFQAAVKMGLGFFNIALSLFPERAMRLLSMIGFEGCRIEGFRLLHESASSDTLRALMCKLVIGFFECFYNQVVDISTKSANLMENIVQSELRQNPKSYWFLLFNGRLRLIEHDVLGALDMFEGSLNLTIDLDQLRNFYTWEILNCHLILGNWDKAIEFVRIFCKKCQWSLATGYYLEAIFLYMILESRLIADDESKNFAKSTECAQMRKQIDQIFSEVPRLVRRYAGRRVPHEKYVCEKIEKYHQDGILVAPAYEYCFIWNLFTFIEGQETIVESILSHIDRCIHHYKFETDKLNENRLMLTLLKGVCHRLLGDLDAAQIELFKIVNQTKEITKICREKNLAPLATLELGIVKLKQQNFAEARRWFERCRSDFSGYSLELFLQMRVHQAIKRLQNLEQPQLPAATDAQSN